MRAVIQRVSHASCTVEGAITGKIGIGFLVLLGIDVDDQAEDVQWLAQKIANMRIFNDEVGLMNKSIRDVKGDILLIPQFTLMANTKKGNRPSFVRAARPEQAIPLYEAMVDCLSEHLGEKVQTGIFGADMKIALLNDGPVTIIMNTKDKENY